MKKKVFLLFTAFLLIAHQFYFSHISLVEFPNLLTAVRAKNYCSCYFVSQLNGDVCYEKVKKAYPAGSFKLDKDLKMVTFSFLWGSSTAKFVSDRYGCELTEN